MPEPRRNVELKARDADQARTFALALELGAADCGTIAQVDTYFTVPHGRLKLRQENPGRAQLIHYQRARQAQQRESRYRVVAVPDPVPLLSALQAALGVELSVSKRRRLLLWRSVRIHLDEVDGLGAFVELEAVAGDASDLHTEHQLVAQLRDALAIDDERLLAVGYAELLRETGGLPAD